MRSSCSTGRGRPPLGSCTISASPHLMETCCGLSAAFSTSTGIAWVTMRQPSSCDSWISSVIGRHVGDAAAVEDGDLGAEAARYPGRIHGDVAAADHGDLAADARVAAAGDIGEHLQAGEYTRVVLALDAHAGWQPTGRWR